MYTSTMKRRIIVALSASIVTALLALGAYKYLGNNTVQPKKTTAGTGLDQQQKEVPQPTAFNKKTYSITDPTSLWVVVNKQRRLQPADYVPGDLVIPTIKLRSNITSNERQVRASTAAALQALSDTAKADGITLTLESGYRSYSFQVSLYNRYVNQQGQAVADTQSARAGYSEHQTGLAADVGGVTKPACNVEACFADTPEGKWVAANAYKQGFVIRYPEGKTPITGYTYEPWHLRYVGVDLATEMHEKQIATLEEFFELPAAPDYN